MATAPAAPSVAIHSHAAVPGTCRYLLLPWSVRAAFKAPPKSRFLSPTYDRGGFPINGVNALVDEVLPAQKPGQTLITGDVHPPSVFARGQRQTLVIGRRRPMGHS